MFPKKPETSNWQTNTAATTSWSRFSRTGKAVQWHIFEAPARPGEVLLPEVSPQEALDAGRDLFDAELRLAQLRRDELVSLMQLYR
jgi:hypothetical protein